MQEYFIAQLISKNFGQQTFTRSHKTSDMQNLCKTLLFADASNTTLTQLKQPQEEPGEHTTRGFVQVGLDNQTSANCKSRLQFHLTNIYQLLYLTSSLNFQSAAVMGRRNSNTQPAQSPVR